MPRNTPAGEERVAVIQAWVRPRESVAGARGHGVVRLDALLGGGCGQSRKTGLTTAAIETGRIRRMKIRAGVFGMAALLGLVLSAIASAQELTLHVTYVCNGDRLFIENCNIRDLSDAANCFVGHPDTILSNGLMKYTNETRGSLKKLLPTCKQPSADEVTRAKAFDKKVQDKQDALQKEAEAKLDAPPPMPGGMGGAVKPQTPEQKALNRCITAGRLPASCTGNSLLGAFSQMVSQVMPSLVKEPPPGMNMAGVFEGAGNWRLDFIDAGVLVNCSFLSPNQENYKVEFKNGRTVIVVDTRPKPLVLTLTTDGTIAGPGPLEIEGVVASGYSGGSDPTSYSGGYHDANGTLISNGNAATSAGPIYDSGGNRVYGAINGGNAGHTTFAPRRATCPALNLSSKGARVGMETMQTDLLKTMFGGDKGPPTPPGLRMHGTYAAQTGLSVEFYPESVIVGCGDPARAYPYQVVANGAQAAVKVDDPGHPLLLTMRPDGSLDPGAGSYLVHGRRMAGQNNDGDFTFAPLEATCNLGVLVPGAKLTAPPITAAAAAPANPTGGASGASRAGAVAGGASTPGNAILSFTSGFVAAQPGAANPLAGRAFVLLRDNFDNVLAKGGFPVPAGVAPYKAMILACVQKTPDCQTASTAMNGQTVAGVRTDAAGKATFPGVPPGTYYLMGATFTGGQMLLWDIKVELRAGANTIALDQRTATPVR
jgi:hypothetical protein